MTVTIDPAKDAEVEAFQARMSNSTGIDNMKAAFVIACQLDERGCEVLSVRANKTPPAWMDIPPASVEISEADFRRHFSGFEAEKTSSMLRRQVNGVRVWCSLPTPPFVPPKPERVTL